MGSTPRRRGRPSATRAKQFTSGLAFGKTVVVRVRGRDRYGRTIGDVILPDGRNLNQELVRAGYAWWFRRYSADQRLAALEAQARASRRGLWADPIPAALGMAEGVGLRPNRGSAGYRGRTSPTGSRLDDWPMAPPVQWSRTK